jgi:hypothetical protein
MGIFIVSLKVKDYAKWRAAFDNDAGAQQSAGLTNPRVFRSVDDENELVLVFDSKDTEMAKDFASSPGLKDKMRESGVVGNPTMYFLKAT